MNIEKNIKKVQDFNFIIDIELELLLFISKLISTMHHHVFFVELQQKTNSTLKYVVKTNLVRARTFHIILSTLLKLYSY